MAKIYIAIVLLLVCASNVYGAASDYSNLCLGCVYNNYMYCAADGVCRESSGTCGGTEYDSSTACPTNTLCSAGNAGSIFVGDTSLGGGYGYAGSVSFSAPSNQPCELTIFNRNAKSLSIAVSGNNVATYSL